MKDIIEDTYIATLKYEWPLRNMYLWDYETKRGMADFRSSYVRDTIIARSDVVISLFDYFDKLCNEK